MLGIIRVLTTTDPDILNRHGTILGNRLNAAIRPAGVTTTRHVMEPGGQDRALAAARELVSAGADTLVWACTGLVTIGMAPILQRAPSASRW